MRRVLVIANSAKPHALEYAARAEKELRRLGAEVFVSTHRHDDLSRFHAEIAVVFGGDGTVLGTVAGFGQYGELPEILAFNLGRLGYLAENPAARMEEILGAAIAGELIASRRMLIEASTHHGGVTWRDHALNEFVLSYRQVRRQLAMSVKVDGEDLMDFRGDGMIISTPTGSTAYSLSAGGPVASPELEAMILTPLCPHLLANRSLVLSPGEVLTMRHYGEFAVEVTADGRYCLELEKGRDLTLRISSRSVNFLFEARGRYRLLREKLGWGWDGIVPNFPLGEG